MTKTFDQLIELAKTNLDQAEECDSFDTSNTYTQLAIPYALIAIAQELHEMNNRENHIFANQHPDNRGIDSDLGW